MGPRPGLLCHYKQNGFKPTSSFLTVNCGEVSSSYYVTLNVRMINDEEIGKDVGGKKRY